MTARDHFVKALDAYTSDCWTHLSTNPRIGHSQMVRRVEKRAEVLRLFDAACQSGAGEAVVWQFQDRSGKWCNFIDERHRANTEADGTWPIRALYAAPPKAEAVAVDGGCICQGNWREIVKDSEPLLEKWFLYEGKPHKFLGPMVGDDDYYYALWEPTARVLTRLSCVTGIDEFSHTPCQAPAPHASGAGKDAAAIRAVVAEWQQHYLSEYQANKTSYREGKSDAADFILTRVDAAMSGEGRST